MDELEQRLSSVLTEMAEGVPPSPNAWVEHQRRLARKSRRARRRPAILAAAAAVAVTLVLVPFLVANGHGGPELTVAQPSPPATSFTPNAPQRDGRSAPTYQPSPGEVVLTQPFSLLDERVGNVELVTYVYTVQGSDGHRMVCSVQQPTSLGTVINGSAAQMRTCATMKPPSNGRYLMAQMPVQSAHYQGVYVYVAARPIERTIVRRAEGGLVTASTRMSGDQFTVFSVQLDSPAAPAAYSLLGAAPAYPRMEDG
ncbi:hypothetical protein [Actinocrispum wychmicini]|uniref:Uncharacterized protein n=1 Tax=Actinocrispum wychmicini TaxID=1213861 RepID=A0A4R2JW75_9PSEU|nr:hypothetical protein [Actinocrispum wychmicini]TCO64741.1 hypothetical protein EV192_101523 [Actinocrispum wychmicini]